MNLAAKIKNKINVPIIFVSFNKDKEAYLKAKKINPIAYFTHPFAIENLFSTIEIGLTNHKLQEEIVDSHKKYEMAIKAGRAGVYEIDPDTFEIDGDESLAEIFGFTVTGSERIKAGEIFYRLKISIKRKRFWQIFCKVKLSPTR